MCGCSSPRIIRNSALMWTAPAPAWSASPSAMSPTAWWSIWRRSFQVAPTFWLNPKNGVSYPIVIQTPQYRLDSLGELKNLPDHRRQARHAANPGRAQRHSPPEQRCGGVALRHPAGFRRLCRHPGPRPWRRRQCHPEGARQYPARPAARRHGGIRGQVETMNTAFSGLFFGLAEAIVLIYLLIVVNFHSWTDPFVIVMALPGRAGRHRLDPVRHPHHLVGAGADRRDHVHGRGDGQFHPGGQLRARTAGSHRRCGARPRSRPASPASVPC